MKRNTIFWILAVVITLVSVVYQRVTGPTYPLHGKVNLDGKEISYKLERSHSSSSNYLIEINTGDPLIQGTLHYRKFNTNDEFTSVKMQGKEVLTAELPKQARLEKLEYYISFSKDASNVKIPEANNIIIRFKDDVPIYIFIPHVFAMFFAMLLSNRTGLEFFNKEPNLKKLSIWTIIILFIGGFPLGFAMNGFAFGEMWGGWPFGHDVTDNKTQVAFIVWLFAFFMIIKNKKPALWALIAAIVLLIVYSIPHSI